VSVDVTFFELFSYFSPQSSVVALESLPLASAPVLDVSSPVSLEDTTKPTVP